MKQITREDYEMLVDWAMQFIKKHFKDEISLDEIALKAGFSPFHFHRIFSAIVGETIKVHQTRLRMELAGYKLKYSKKSITEITFECGYNSLETFSRAFRRFYGTSASQYRKACDTNSEPIIKQRPIRTISNKGIVMKLEIKTFEDISVLTCPYKGSYDNCGVAWEKLMSSPVVQKLLGKDTQSIGVCYSDPEETDEEDIRYKAAVSVPEGTEGDDGIFPEVIEGGKFAVYLYKGPYNQVNDAYKGIYGNWLPDSGYRPRTDYSLMVHLNSWHDTPEEELLTEIRIPIE